jgi:hypothetical protein
MVDHVHRHLLAVGDGDEITVPDVNNSDRLCDEIGRRESCP